MSQGSWQCTKALSVLPWNTAAWCGWVPLTHRSANWIASRAEHCTWLAPAPTCLAYHIAEPLPHSATSTSSTTWRTPTLLQPCYLLQALPTHDELDSPPLNDNTTSYCLPTQPTRPYENSGVYPTRPWQRGILSPYPPSASSWSGSRSDL